MDDNLFKAFELYQTERTRFTTAKHEASKSYDQTVLTFSAGAIGLSITFLEKFAPTPQSKWLLYSSWILFSLAMFSTLWSLLIAQRAFEEERKVLDKKYQDLLGVSLDPDPPANPLTFGVPLRWLTMLASMFKPSVEFFGRAVKWLNRFAFVFFVAGVMLFGWFALANWALKREVKEEDSTMAKGKSTPPSPRIGDRSRDSGHGRARGGNTPDPGVLPPIKSDQVPTPPSKDKK